MTTAILEAMPAALGDVNDDPGGERYTDMANAQRLAIEAVGHIAHAQANRDEFYIFDGSRLNLEAKTGVLPYVKAVARRLFQESRDLEAQAEACRTVLDAQQGNVSRDAVAELHKTIDKLMKLTLRRRAGAERLESRDGAYAAIELVKAEPTVHISMAQLDAHSTWLNTPTGTLDLDSGAVWTPRFEPTSGGRPSGCASRWPTCCRCSAIGARCRSPVRTSTATRPTG